MSLLLYTSTYVENSSFPAITYPCYAAAWVAPNHAFPAANTAGMFWSIGSNVVRNAFSFGIFTQVAGGVPNWCLNADNGTAFQTTVISSPIPVIGQWHFLLARFYSSANRRLSIWSPGSAPAHAQGTTAVTAGASFTRMRLGQRADNTSQLAEMYIAQYFCAEGDIVPDGGAIPNDMLIRLATKGPFAFPHIRKDIVEYRSFRAPGRIAETTAPDVISYMDQNTEVYFGKYGRQTLGIGSGTHGDLVYHPPLISSEYVTPLHKRGNTRFNYQVPTSAVAKFRTTLAQYGTRGGARQLISRS